MIKRIEVLILLLLVSRGLIFAQQLSQQVLVPTAGVVASGSLNYSQTIGETAIEIIGSSGFVLTQGFQQPGIKISDADRIHGNGVDVYPNPASDYITVKFFGDVARKFKIEVISITGMVVSSGEIEFITNYFYEKRFDFTSLKRGMYFVRVASQDGIINRTFKIEKI
jgi:hypothetical protein